MSEEQKSKILEEGEDFRVVLLSKNYDKSYIADQMVIFRKDFYEHYVILVQRGTSEPPIILRLGYKTADAFCEAWQQWKVDSKAKEEQARSAEAKGE